MQDYKTLCAVVTICAALVNIQTDTQTVTGCVGFKRRTPHIIRHFGHDSFQTINCSGSDN